MSILGIIGIALLSLGYGIGIGVYIGVFMMCMQNDFEDVAHAPNELKWACLLAAMRWPLDFIKGDGNDTPDDR